MVVWVAERASAAKTVDRVIVATDNSQVADTVRGYGFEALMTREDHASGTDRLTEVASQLDVEFVINVQGDEPLISPATIDSAVVALQTNTEAGIATTWEQIDIPEDVVSPDVVKIVVGKDGRALYFSRSPVPFPRDAVAQYGAIDVALVEEPDLMSKFKKHTGLYVYRREVLLQFAHWPETVLEKLERLEQLRALENGVTIVAIEAATRSIGVDTAADLRRVEAVISQKSEHLRVRG
jgi:3-deoxy-manno-octulosonate cytidylyltransferase (CMP-KDO synthetase)